MLILHNCYVHVNVASSWSVFICIWMIIWIKSISPWEPWGRDWSCWNGKRQVCVCLCERAREAEDWGRAGMWWEESGVLSAAVSVLYKAWLAFIWTGALCLPQQQTVTPLQPSQWDTPYWTVTPGCCLFLLKICRHRSPPLLASQAVVSKAIEFAATIQGKGLAMLT